MFKHNEGDNWKSHAPPIYGSNGKNILTRDQTLMMGIKMFHYPLITREQAKFKTKYYKHNYEKIWAAWQKDHRTRLVYGDTAYKFEGQHPEVIKKLIDK